MQRVRTSPFLLHTDDVRGFVFDVTTGSLREITARLLNPPTYGPHPAYRPHISTGE